MWKPALKTLAFAGLMCLAPFAIGQNADPNTAGPTKNDLRLKLSEPQEGAQITGRTLRVAVDYNRTIFGAGQGTKFGEKNFPMPIFKVFVDDNQKATLRGGEANVAEIPDVPPGTHKIVVVATNISGEVIDRTTVNVTNMDAVASAPVSSDSNAVASSAPPPAPAPAPVSAEPPPPDTMATTMPTADSSTLPQTASSAPATALLGLTLLAGGLLVARRTR
jgi:LPXTG-motif cell wall-anchored protein